MVRILRTCALAALVLIAGGVVAAGGPVGATEGATTGVPPAGGVQALPIPIPTAVAALTEDQSVRLTMVNLGASELTVDAAVMDTDGVLASKALVLAPDETGQLTMSGARRGLSFDTRGRLQVWGEFTVTTGEAAAGSLEVFDRASGTTRVLLNANLPEPNPIPEPLLVSGSMGLREGQMARVSVLNRGVEPVSVSAGIFQVERVVGRVVTLQPGEVASVDMNPVARGLVFDRTGRVQIRGRVACRQTLDCLVVSTLEVYFITNGHSSEADPMLTPIQLP